MSNPTRFKVLELTQGKGMNVSQIAKELGFKYKRCSEYIVKLEKESMVKKIQDGRTKTVKSKIILGKGHIDFV